MKTRAVAAVIFYNNDFNIAVQIRGGHAKGKGIKYGFWGGKIETGETKEDAIKRELKEELGFLPKKLKYWGKFTYIFQEIGKYTGWKIIQHVFLSPITPKLLGAKVSEGTGIKIMSLDEVILGRGFPKGSTYFLKNLKSCTPGRCLGLTPAK